MKAKQSELKIKAKEAKRRLQSGFWEKHKENIDKIRDKAKAEGLNMSKVIEYFEEKSSRIVIKTTGKDDFYEKVKNLLDAEGEVSNAIWRLIDKDYYATLDYESKQRHLLEVSSKYREALDRYKKEKVALKN